MKKRIITFYLGLCLALSLHAAGDLVYKPEKPIPGDKIVFTYTPAPGLFGEKDIVRCVAQNWVSQDEMMLVMGSHWKPVDVELKKAGNSYEGTVQTDTDTRMISLSFISGDLEFERLNNEIILKSGIADNNNKSGYCIPFYTPEGKEARFTNLCRGKFLAFPSMNSIGIIDAKNGGEFMKKEYELYPESQYQIFQWLPFCWAANYPEKYRQFAESVMENLWGSGLKTQKDMRLVASISASLKLRNP